MDGLILFLQRNLHCQLTIRLEEESQSYRVSMFSMENGRRELRIPANISGRELTEQLDECASRVK